MICYQNNLIWFLVDKLDKIGNLFLANMSNFELFWKFSILSKGDNLHRTLFFLSIAFIKDRTFLKICRYIHIKKYNFFLSKYNLYKKPSTAVNWWATYCFMWCILTFQSACRYQTFKKIWDISINLFLYPPTT